ncbi:MAG TPA: hypothetical protein VHD85_02230 [Terracidiphilus sp.]|nr:hypothetical protein [Terracidiphilus sp.]
MSTWKPALKPIINTNDTNTNTNNNTNENASTTTSGSTWANANKPTTPTSELSEKVQSAQAGILQHHYVRAQLHVLNNNEESIIKETIEAMREHMPNGHKSKEGKLKADFEHMTMRLQRADLTINFNAGSWFMEPNNYDSYTQMYERAVRTVNGPAIAGAKQMRLTDSKVNKAVDRVTTDDRVTFNQGMMSGNSGIGRIMSPGKLIIPLVDAREGEFESTNPYFNPKSKQVFAALNYGRRPHGASTYYGTAIWC